MRPFLEGNKGAIGTGRAEIDRFLGQGIPPGSLALIEGRHAAGKSVLCQHLTYNALQSGTGVAYYTSDTGSPSLISRMGFLGLDVVDYFLLDRLRVYPLDVSQPQPHPQPSDLLDTVSQHLAELPPEMELVVLDSLAGLVSRCPRAAFLRFFSQCRSLCHRGKTVVLALDVPRPGDPAAPQIYAWCDVHIRLKLDVVLMERVVKALEVRKAPGSRQATDAGVNFDVYPGRGIHVLTTRGP